MQLIYPATIYTKPVYYSNNAVLTLLMTKAENAYQQINVQLELGQMETLTNVKHVIQHVKVAMIVQLLCVMNVTQDISCKKAPFVLKAVKMAISETQLQINVKSVISVV